MNLPYFSEKTEIMLSYIDHPVLGYYFDIKDYEISSKYESSDNPFSCSYEATDKKRIKDCLFQCTIIDVQPKKP